MVTLARKSDITKTTFKHSNMLRIVFLLFLFSMACMGQTFQYSRGWTNGKRSGGQNNIGSSAAISSLYHKEDDGFQEFFDIHEGSEKKLERCLLQIQHLIRNPLLLHSAAASLAVNPLAISNSNHPNGNNNYGTANNSNNNNNNNNNPFSRSHQSNELFEELSSSVIDANDYGKH